MIYILSLCLATFAFAEQKFFTLKELNGLQSPFTLGPLPYATDSLEKAVDQKTMEIHHGFHHKVYVDNLNIAILKEGQSLKSLLGKSSTQSDSIRNNAGGHWNHTFFWTVLSGKEEDNQIPPRLEKEISNQFGSLEKFKEEFEKASTTRFGSGWAWLIRNKKGKLEITSTPNQDNPLMDLAPVKGTPIFGMDIWEHAYYLRYQNKRTGYLKAMWDIVNWKQVDAFDREIAK